MDVDRELRETGLAFLNAPFDPDGWSTALSLLAGTTGSHSAQLLGVGGPSLLTFNVITNRPDDPHRHLDNPVIYGPANWRLGVAGAALTIQHDQDYTAYRASVARSGTPYDDAVSDLDIPHGCQSPLLREDEKLVGIALLRSRREGPCSADDLALFQRVARHAQRAVRVELALGREAAIAMLDGELDQDEATLLLDGYGSVMALTEAAEALLDCPIGIRLDGTHLRLANDAEDWALRAAMHRLLAGNALDGPILHEARAGRCESRPEGWWRLLLTRLPATVGALGLGARLAVTLRPATA